MGYTGRSDEERNAREQDEKWLGQNSIGRIEDVECISEWLGWGRKVDELGVWEAIEGNRWTGMRYVRHAGEGAR